MSLKCAIRYHHETKMYGNKNLHVNQRSRNNDRPIQNSIQSSNIFVQNGNVKSILQLHKLAITTLLNNFQMQ